MSTVKFAEEFTHLISRWTKPQVLNKDGADNLAPLTNKQVLNTVKTVVQVILGVHLHETSEAGIAASSPSSPAAPKMKPEQILKSSESFIFGYLDELLPSPDSNNVNRVDLLSSKSQEEMEIVKYNTLGLLSADKKFISRSNPAIHVSFTDKPDASIREQAERGALHNATEQQGDKMKIRLFLNKIEMLRKCATDVVANIDELKKEMCPQTATPIRRLSSIAASPGPSGSSSLLRKVPPPNLRRSSTGFTGTSTTKKLNTTVTLEDEKASARRQTIAPGSIHIKPSKILPSNRSHLVTGSTTKKSPPSTFRTAKNPKYAHIRSTIPKVTSTRKAQ